MERDDTLVSRETLDTTCSRFSDQGLAATLQALVEAEPHLGTFLTENASRVAGKLALCGASRRVIRGVHQDLLASSVLVYLAMREGAYQIWKDTALGPRLLALDATGTLEEGNMHEEADDNPVE